MSRRPARPGGIEAFLLHLAAEGVISTAQLQRSQEALRLWAPATSAVTPEGGTEQQQQPLQRPPGSEAAQGSHGQHAGGSQEANEQLPRDQPSFLPRARAAKRRCLNSEHQIQEGDHVLPPALPAAPKEGPLSLLPNTLLDHLMSLLLAEPGASSIRSTCSWLRDSFDRNNTRLALRQPEAGAPIAPPPLQALKLLLSSPCVSSLAMPEELLPLTEAGDAGRFLHRLDKLSLLPSRDGSTRPASFVSLCTNLTHLDLQGCHVSELPRPLSLELQQLVARGCFELRSLAPLAACGKLLHLDLSGLRQLENLGPLAYCLRLQHLDIEGCAMVRNLRPLASCVELQHLNLKNCHKLIDIRPLASCVKLLHLDLRGCRLLEDLGPLSACAELQHLDLQSCSLVQDLGPLAACTGLRLLHVSGGGIIPECRVHDISALAACTRLQSLTITDARQLRDLSPLAACCGLQHLDLSACSGVVDIGPLAACAELRRLKLSQCLALERLGALAACVELGHLDLCNSSCKDLRPLASCAQLQVLSIWDCKAVKDLSPLSACGKLRYLDLRGCAKVRELRPLALCAELRVLEVSSLSLAAQDLAPLAALPHLTIMRV